MLLAGFYQVNTWACEPSDKPRIGVAIVTVALRRDAVAVAPDPLFTPLCRSVMIRA
jgi:hypothetical protein